MHSLESNLGPLVAALQANKGIECTQEGMWKVKSRLTQWIDQFFRREDPTLVHLFTRHMCLLEGVPVNFSDQSTSTMDFKQWVQAAKAVAKRYKYCQSRKLRKVVQALNIEIVKLEYRIEHINGGRDSAQRWGGNHRKIHQLIERVVRWKKEQPLYPVSQHALSQDDLAKLDRMCAYSALIKRLLKNDQAMNVFLKLCIRDNLGVDELCQYSHQIQDLHTCHMIGRIGAFSRQILTVSKKKGIKTLNLLFENRSVSILDRDKTIKFSNGTKLTIKQVFDDFHQKNTHPGNCEFFYDGVRRWNGHHWGDDFFIVDPEKKKFWNDFPYFDSITAEKIENKYGINIVDDTDWIGIIESSSQSTQTELDNSHGYMQIFIPEGGGHYRVLPIGMFAERFPNTSWEKLKFIADTLPGIPVFPDPNYFYSHRRKASFPVLMKEEEGEKILAEIGLKKKEGGIFQWTWENCAFFAQNTFAKVFKMENEGGMIPELFKMHFSECRPRGIIKVVHWFYSLTPKPFKRIYEYCLHFLLGSKRSLTLIENGQWVTKSAFNTPFGKDTLVNIPAKMQERVKVVNYGHV